MSWSQNHHLNSPFQKPNEPPYQKQIPLNITVVKNQIRNHPFQYDYMKTPILPQNQLRKGMIFLGSNRSKHLFPVYKDSQIGIVGQFQNKIHHSNHDDDKMTTTTQLGLAISQTCEDLFQVIKYDKCSQSSLSSFTQTDQNNNLRLS